LTYLQIILSHYLTSWFTAIWLQSVFL
jgi:hypothetical protein